jgi:hypothetical protein
MPGSNYEEIEEDIFVCFVKFFTFDQKGGALALNENVGARWSIMQGNVEMRVALTAQIEKLTSTLTLPEDDHNGTVAQKNVLITERGMINYLSAHVLSPRSNINHVVSIYFFNNH